MSAAPAKFCDVEWFFFWNFGVYPLKDNSTRLQTFCWCFSFFQQLLLKSMFRREIGRQFLRSKRSWFLLSMNVPTNLFFVFKNGWPGVALALITVGDSRRLSLRPCAESPTIKRAERLWGRKCSRQGCQKFWSIFLPSKVTEKNHFIVCHLTEHSTILGLFWVSRCPPFWKPKRPWGRGCVLTVRMPLWKSIWYRYWD